MGESGASAPDLRRRHGISEGTLYRWNAKFSGMEVTDAACLKALEEENLRCKTARWRGEKPVPVTRPNGRWSMDFKSDQLANGRIVRVFNVVDDYTRQCLAMEVVTSLIGVRVTRVLATVWWPGTAIRSALSWATVLSVLARH